MDFLELTHKKLDLNEINDLVTHASCGAVSYFVGTTRDNFNDKTVISLEYEAYDQMAVKAMKSICTDIRNKWPDIVNVAIYHRLGNVPVKEASVIIAVSSPHRNTSLEAVQFTIESLKKIVPIWKKEKYSHPEGSSEWKENKESVHKHRYPSVSNGDEAPPSKKRILNKKIGKLSFEDCILKVPLEEQMNPDKKIVQITASESEIERRVNCFIERKREEIDLLNIQDFTLKNSNSCNNEGDDNNFSSCARIDSVVYKMKNSKGHLRVQRVKNEIGPQVVDYKNELDKLMTNKIIKTEKLSNSGVSQGIDDRLKNVELVLEIPNPVSKNIYQRLKIIEDKLLYLESVSPEYFGIVDKDKKILTHGIDDKQEKKSYSTSELDDLLNKLKSKITCT